MKKSIRRSLAVLMCLMTAVAFMPTFAFAADVSEASQTTIEGQQDAQEANESTELGNGAGEAEPTEETELEPQDISVQKSGDIQVRMTVSNQGILAKASDNSVMLNKSVTVEDIDEDGHLSYDEALLAAHKAYASGGEEAYLASDSSYGKQVNKLWGVDTYNTLFFVNGKSLASSVDSSEVKSGDKLYASINVDNTNYADWYTYFNKETKDVYTNEEFSLNLKGFQGMAGGKAKAATGVEVGIWENGNFTQIDNAVTDEDGDVELSFDEAGTYIVTAKGCVNDTWEDWSGKSITADCPIMAPACVVTVTADPDKEISVNMTINKKGQIATDKNGDDMVLRSIDVKDIDADGKFTYHEALVAAHTEYANGGAGDYGYSSSAYGTTVNKLWGVSTSNVLFFINGEGLKTGVGDDEIKPNDKLYASINADNETYADVMTYFNRDEISLQPGESITLTLKGYLGMAYEEKDKTPRAIPNVEIGTLKNGSFSQIQHKETNSKGKVTLQFDKKGTYYITAKGTAEQTAINYNLIELGGNPAVYGTMDFQSYDSEVAYTDADYGNGPYPASEVKYVDFYDWLEDQDSYHALHSNEMIVDAPIMAPICVVRVGEEGISIISVLQNIVAEFKAEALIPNAKAAATSTTSTELKWELNEMADGYELSTDEGQSWKAIEGSTKAFANLKPATEYKYQVRGYVYVNGEGTKKVYGKASEAKITTPLAKAGTPSVKTKSRRLTATWKEVEGAEGYQVRIGTNSGVTKGLVKYTTSGLSKTSKKLKKNKTYYVKVRAFSGNVYGPWSSSKKIKCK